MGCRYRSQTPYNSNTILTRPTLILVSLSWTGTSSSLTSVGSTTLTPTMRLNDVLCVPGLSLNLLSVSKLTHDLHCSAHFYPDHCVFQDQLTKKQIGEGRERNGLYYMEPVSKPLAAFIHSVSADLWHGRLGHPSNARLRLLSSNNLIAASDISKDSFCSSCPLAKQHRLPFPLSQELSLRSFDLIHTDIWGPTKNPSLSGARHFIIFVDDCTRCVWLYLLKQKSDAYEVFLSMPWSRHNSISPSRLCEVIMGRNSPLMPCSPSFRKSDLLLIQTYHPSTEWGCGKEESTLVGSGSCHHVSYARAHTFWGEAVMTACYLINRMPTPLLGNKCPQELCHAMIL